MRILPVTVNAEATLRPRWAWSLMLKPTDESFVDSGGGST
jgi:hypothetical protein